MEPVVIPVPSEFNFEFCLQFLTRSPREIMHRVGEQKVTKLIRVGDELVLFSVASSAEGLIVTFPNSGPAEATSQAVVAYVREWFDLDTDLAPFYRLARKDELLRPVIKKFRGHRIMSHPDLFESLIWAVLGQQINLQFAYTLKQKFVERFGEKIEMDGRSFHLFPTPQQVASLQDSDLLPLQFSRQKSAYTINIARAFAAGEISREKLKGLSLDEAKAQLMKIKGVGNWTANYALMRTFRYPDAFPLEDAGLHNALKRLLRMKKKPDLKRVKSIFRKYKGWEAYATIYFWKTL